jgi:para-nitrobenzyl esterase
MRTLLRSARRSIVTVAACELVGAMGFQAQASGQAESDDPAVATTAAGQVRGEVTEDRRTFVGIPYAAPPVVNGDGSRPGRLRPGPVSLTPSVPGVAAPRPVRPGPARTAYS